MIQTIIICDECEKAVTDGAVGTRELEGPGWGVFAKHMVDKNTKHFCSPGCMVMAFSRMVNDLWAVIKRENTSV